MIKSSRLIVLTFLMLLTNSTMATDAPPLTRCKDYRVMGFYIGPEFRSTTILKEQIAGKDWRPYQERRLVCIVNEELITIEGERRRPYR